MKLDELKIYDSDMLRGPGTKWHERHNALVEIIEEITEVNMRIQLKAIRIVKEYKDKNLI